jgi:hypothetical protein
VADEVYERLYFGGACRAELPGRGQPDDRLVVVHSFQQELPDDRLAPGLAGAAGHCWKRPAS